ncbi:hypothetical protein CDG81_17275 [Actinopolyspora erythraea]|uniref:Tn3 transposase DDE domain-containing protein n=1 Tax=Actinopolyspora erythraea TaxID=414996 RepID=A0A099D0M9_9ACTN|nr:hypothetical protein [Actinopolyspora erythraea]ASU79725.1 hypothetical protein CDG81_17275 [Actinopolyspora erythraea]KGI79554.1 hypothetical protein IL38_22825 [Actinopolyspora erythraea]
MRMINWLSAVDQYATALNNIGMSMFAERTASAGSVRQCPHRDVEPKKTYSGRVVPERST